MLRLAAIGVFVAARVAFAQGADAGAEVRSEAPDAGSSAPNGGGLTIEEWDGKPGAPPDAGRSTSSGGQAASADGGSSAPSGGGLTIEEFTPAELSDAGVAASPSGGLDSFASGPGEAEAASPTARVYGAVATQAGVDTSFDSPRHDPLAENVFELRTRAVLGADVKVTDSIRLLAEARAWWRITGQRGFDRTKGTFELMPGEAFVDVYTKKVDFRFGNQVVAFGANAAFAPSDQLNPRDLRESFLLAEPDALKLPNLGVRAIGTIGKVNWTAVYFPFFEPNRYSVTGQDEAILQPALGLDLTRQVDESIEDQLQPHILETKRPKALPWLGDLGLRATTKAGPVTVGASWIWVYEKMPMVTMDPELAALVRAGTRGNDPDKAIAASVQDRFIAGETLITGEYPRQHVFSLEGQTLIRTVNVDVDVAYTPAQTIYASDLKPLRKSVITWVVGLSQAEDSPLFYNVTYVGMAVPDLPSQDYLFLLEPATAAGAPRTVSFHALFATAGYAFLDRRLDVSARLAFEPIQRSWAFAPRVAWKGWQRMTVAVGAEFYEGKTFSPFGYFGRNDQIVGQFAYDFF